MKRYIKSSSVFASTFALYNKETYTDADILAMAEDMCEYFMYHNRNLNRLQDGLVDDLSAAVSAKDIKAIRRIVEKFKYNSKNLNKEQEWRVEYLYGAFNYAGAYAGTALAESKGVESATELEHLDILPDDAVDGDFEDYEDGPDYKYCIESFYGENFRGLAEEEYAMDLDEAIDIAHDFVCDGNDVRITNLDTGKSQSFTYDEYFDIGEEGFPNSDFAESPFDRNLLACNNINSATSITASAWKSPSGKKYGKQTRRFPGSYLFTRKELKQMVDDGDARYIGGNLDEVDSYDVIGFSWNETNGYKSGILVEDRNTGELLVGNTASATIAHF